MTAYVDVLPCALLAGISGGLILRLRCQHKFWKFRLTVVQFLATPFQSSFDAAGGTGNLSVLAASGCSWSATSTVTWISVTSGTSGNGNGTVVFQVQANLTGQARTGSLSIARQTFTVNQAAL